MAYAPPRVSGSRVAKATKEKQPPASDLLRRITRSMTTDASRRAVFNTTELLEKVISFLPPFEILTKAQRVSSSWKNTIANSPTVKSLLWRPRVTRVLTPSAYSYEFSSTRNPTRMAFFARNRLTMRPVDAALTTGVPKYSEAVKFQELFFTAPGRIEDGTLALHVKWTPIGDCNAAKLDWIDDMNATSHATPPTWHDVYITSPPITAALIDVSLKPVNRVGKMNYATVYDRNGITCGTVAEVLKKMRHPRPAEKFNGWMSISFVAEATEPDTESSEPDTDASEN
jgi:hypothetical protein